MTYEDVIEEFDDAVTRRAFGDDYLRGQGCPVRADVPVAAEYGYGIIFLRDDAVELLIDRIRELERVSTK